MPPKATLAAITVLCFGLPVAAASAFTVPDVGSRALSGVVLAQADKRLKGLRDELAKAREALQEAKKSGGDVEAAQKRVDAAQKAVQAAGKDSGARKAEGDKGEDKQRKGEGKPGDRKKAEDKQDEPRKAREKKADGDKDEEKQQRKTEGKPEDKNKAEDKGDEPRKAREKKADGDKGEEKQQRKTEGKPEDKKKAEDKQDEPRKAREKKADGDKDEDKQRKSEGKPEDKKKAEDKADEPRKSREKKAEDKKPAEQPQKAEEQKQPETEAKEAPSKAEQEAKPGDDRKRAAEEPQPDKRRFDSRDGDGDRRRRAGRDDRDGVREGEKTPAKELATKKIEEGKEAIIDGGDRVLRREGGKIVIRSDDHDRFDRGERRDERLDDGRTRVIISRPDGSQVITVRGRDGDIVRRVRRMRDGREIVIIDEDEWRRNGDRDRDRDKDRDRDRRADRDRDRDHRDDGDRDRRADWDRDRDHRGDWDRHRGRDRDHDFRVELGPLRITIPRERYIVESRGASRYELEEALTAPPVEPVERYYSLEDVRRSDRLRDMMRRIDVSAITFETDSAAISRSQIDALEELGYVLGSIIDRQPGELFLIEGHTDAVGSDLYNLALSDRRAESVAIALSDYFNVPPENLVTQGYGETYLKIPTPYSERENRRVTVRRITPLIRSAEQ